MPGKYAHGRAILSLRESIVKWAGMERKKSVQPPAMPPSPPDSSASEGRTARYAAVIRRSGPPAIAQLFDLPDMRMFAVFVIQDRGRISARLRRWPDVAYHDAGDIPAHPAIAYIHRIVGWCCVVVLIHDLLLLVGLAVADDCSRGAIVGKVVRKNTEPKCVS